MEKDGNQKKLNYGKRKVIISAVVLLAVVIIILFIFIPNPKTGSNKEAISQLFQEKEEVVIDCLGDSITFGLYKDVITPDFQSKPTYPESLEQNLNKKLQEIGIPTTVRTVNDGISGDVITKETYQRIVCSPDIVVILYSGNNFNFHYPYKGTLEANITTLREDGKILYLVNYPLHPDSKFYEPFHDANAYIEKTAHKLSVPWMDMNQYFNELVSSGTYTREEIFSQDKVHLSPLGYRLLGEKVSEIIFDDITK